MPELPEVETIRRVLEPQIKGSAIMAVTARRPEVIAYPSAEEFCGRLTGQVISSMSRRGKFLRLHMDSGDQVILHLRMTGGLLVTPPDYPEEKHTHVIFHLHGGNMLRFADMRRFGRFWLIRADETDRMSGIDRLGIEPFDARLNPAYLQAHFGKRKKAIKACLLEQGVIAGIGNIYADEILFEAGVQPSVSANELTEAEWERLAETIPTLLHDFIEKNQIPAEDYLRTKGKAYRNTPFLRVYGHAGEPCPACGETLLRVRIDGRSSVYCPKCQRKSGEKQAEVRR